MRSPSLEQATGAVSRRATTGALQFLVAQAESGFPDAAHTMIFPRRAGFLFGGRETHRSDVFARATIANVLLDCAELYRRLSRTLDESTCRALARREAHYLAGAKLSDCAGGWSYFSTLPELPPDLDSLAAMISLFARVGDGLPELLQAPIQLALGGRSQNGGLATWLVSESDPPQRRRTMLGAIERFWGTGPDPEVNAVFGRALLRLDAELYSDAIAKAARFVAEQQASDGTWPASWYWDLAWGSLAALDLLMQVNTERQFETSMLRCKTHFAGTQNPEGGWGQWQTVPLETALALHVLTSGGVDSATAVTRGLNCLLGLRTQAGHWKGSPWIRMDPGRAQRSTGKHLTFMSHSVSTAVCLRTVLRLETLGITC